MNHQQYEIYHETKAHTSEDFPYNTYLCSIPLDFQSIPAHWHNEMELIVIKKGIGNISVNLETVEVSAGDIIFVLPGQLHSISQKEHLSMEYENIFFKQSLLKAVNEDLCHRDFLHPLYNGMVDFPFHITANYSHYSKLKACIDQIDIHCSSRPKGYQLAVKGLLFQLFFLLVSEHPTKQVNLKGKKSLDKIKQVLSYVQEHYENPISIEEIAKVCFYSESHFMKFFKDCMGVTFNQYLNDYRLQVAAQLLKETDDNIIEIAAACGFDNLSYFNRSFKKKYNISPGKYRNISFG